MLNYIYNLKDMRIKNLVFLFVFSFIFSGFSSDKKPKDKIVQRLNFDANWKFIQKDITGAEQSYF